MSKDYLQHIEQYNIRQAWPVPEKVALLVIDMQLYFKDVAQPIVDNVISLIECFRANNRQIFFTRHGHRDPKTVGGMHPPHPQITSHSPPCTARAILANVHKKL